MVCIISIFCFKKMKKGVDSFRIGCYSDKAVAQNRASGRGWRGKRKEEDQQKVIDIAERK